MPEEVISPKKISDLIDHIMKSKDPATVGLRRILKKKSDLGKDFPLQSHTLEEFSTKDSSGKVFSDNEKQLIELEKEVLQMRNIIAEQKKNTEQAVEEAHQRGLEEGIKQGEEAGRAQSQAVFDQQLKTIEERLVSLFDSIRESRKVLYQEAHREILDLCIIMVRKIINTELSINPEIVLLVIKKALTFIADRQGFVVRVSPDDLEMVTNKKDFWTSISDRLNAITVEQDERIEKGGCIVESNTGITDARIPVQIGELIEVIDSTWDNLVTSGSIQADEETGGVPVQNEQAEQSIENEQVSESMKDVTQLVEEDQTLISEEETLMPVEEEQVPVSHEETADTISEESVSVEAEEAETMPEQVDNSDPPDFRQDSDKNPEPLE